MPKARKSYPLRSSDAPATKGMVIALKDTMNARFDAAARESDSRFKEVDARFNQVDARFNQVDAKFSKLEAKIDTVIARVSEMALQNEAQRSDNRITLEGLQAVLQRQDRTEDEVKNMTAVIKAIARHRLESQA